MNPSNHPSQDFLELLHSTKRGKLKVYIGAIAGTGKTFRMLQEARELISKGADIVLAYIETHGRKDPENMLNGLEIIPRMKHEYRGVYIEEMDLDAVLARKPQIAIVDELAHTNLPICRNGKRYQDVIELLIAGINVICAFNVQHLESLNDLVEQTTGIKVFETIPDDFLKNADQVINIDISAEDLIERLKSGKIYKQENIQDALQNFFITENIKVLRELALRAVAESVDRVSNINVETYQTKPESESSNKIGVDRLMVCLKPQNFEQKYMLRKASRLAGKLNTDWYVVYVETQADQPKNIDSEVQRILFHDIQFAKELGCKFIHLFGEDREKTWLDFAEKELITNLVLNIEDTSLMNIILGKSTLRKIIKSKKNFDLFMVNPKLDSNKEYVLEYS